MNSGIKKSAIYTRTGDKGQSTLIGGRKISKNHSRLKAYGALDEVNSFIGLAIIESANKDLTAQLQAIQSDLFVIGSQLACEDDSLRAKLPLLDNNRLKEIEKNIDGLDAILTPLKNFILPGGSKGAALLHVCRTVCRRAEREIVALHEKESVEPKFIEYINRLSDYFFIAARVENQRQNIQDIVWITKP